MFGKMKKIVGSGCEMASNKIKNGKTFIVTGIGLALFGASQVVSAADPFITINSTTGQPEVNASLITIPMITAFVALITGFVGYWVTQAIIDKARTLMKK